MKQVAIAALALVAGASAQQSAYGQCGGTGWTGATTCVSGYTCTYSNDFYSQCVPGTAATTSKTTTKTSSTTKTTTSSTKTSTTKTSSSSTSKTSSTKTTTKATTTTTGSTGGSTKLPASSGSTTLPTAKVISGTFDGGMLLWDRSPAVCEQQTETGEDAAMFILEDGATIKNALIGPGQAEGIHCRGTCTIQNVWWTDVCEDAGTFLQTSGTSYVIGGGAFHAADKIFQFNGRGTVSISNFYANDYGKVARSCGDCTSNGGPRNFIISGVTAVDGGVLCGINTNYGDTCKITNSCQDDGKSCDRYTGVTDHDGESTKIGSGPDGTYCTVSGLTTSCT